MITENSTTKTNSSTPAAASPLTVKPDLVKTIGSTTYEVSFHFSETSKETMSDKIKRLIRRDMNGQ